MCRFNSTFVYATNGREGLSNAQGNKKKNVRGSIVFVPSLLNQEKEWWNVCFLGCTRENAGDTK